MTAFDDDDDYDPMGGGPEYVRPLLSPVPGDSVLALSDAISIRRCEGCDALLPLGWPAVYCSNQCAVADA